MTKKYGIKNTSECVLRLPVGRAVVVCNFTNGNLQSREPIPASFSTANPIVQYAIETCDRFKSNKIFIMAKYDDEPSVEDAPKAEPEKPKKAAKKAERKPKVNEDVKTFGEAVTALMTEDGVKVGDLTDVNACLRKAEELGISFPNLK